MMEVRILYLLNYITLTIKLPITVITPWESAHFGYFDQNNTVVPLRHRRIYYEDAIGLKTLDNEGKLKLVTVEHVKHVDWHINRDVINEVVLPYLD